ncbi:uncharacterized protein LOC104917449 [Meleagris gallopavo]|uniref:uncharacterized protein LOC104917449 n=1 Tax=Meleagris gallopavo TaxID=9103 RepID=UPI000549AE5E|nr:uncharacterized protein LOC104917449 [Meleagris gallopavo]
MTGLRAAIGAAESCPDHPLHGSSLMRLVGMVRGMETPQGQAARLRPGELIAATDVMIQAFKRVAKGVEPVDPWIKVIQGPTESFSAFVDKLLKAIQGSELLKSAQGPVIMDYLQQQGQLEVRELLRTAPQLSTPGEMIKYILDKQKTESLTNEGLAAAIVAAVGTQQPQGPCYGCGQEGHIKANCPIVHGARELQGLARGPIEPICWNCGGRGHTTCQCPSKSMLRRDGHQQGNGGGRVPLPHSYDWANPRSSP